MSLCWFRRGFKIIVLAPSSRRCEGSMPALTLLMHHHQQQQQQQQQPSDETQRHLTTRSSRNQFAVENAQRTRWPVRRQQRCRRQNTVACLHLANWMKLAPILRALYRLIVELLASCRCLCWALSMVKRRRRQTTRRWYRRFATSVTFIDNQNPANCSWVVDWKRRQSVTSLTWAVVGQRSTTTRVGWPTAGLTYFRSVHFLWTSWPNLTRWLQHKISDTHCSILH